MLSWQDPIVYPNSKKRFEKDFLLGIYLLCHKEVIRNIFSNKFTIFTKHLGQNNWSYFIFPSYNFCHKSSYPPCTCSYKTHVLLERGELFFQIIFLIHCKHFCTVCNNIKDRLRIWYCTYFLIRTTLTRIKIECKARLHKSLEYLFFLVLISLELN